MPEVTVLVRNAAAAVASPSSSSVGSVIVSRHGSLEQPVCSLPDMTIDDAHQATLHCGEGFGKRPSFPTVRAHTRDILPPRTPEAEVRGLPTLEIVYHLQSPTKIGSAGLSSIRSWSRKNTSCSPRTH